MTIDARSQYLSVMRKRYVHADTADRSLLLDEICETCGYARKHAIRVMNADPTKTKRAGTGAPRGRPRRYCDPAIVTFLQHLRRAMNLACSKRLHAAIPRWLPFYEEAYHRVLSEENAALLLEISPATIDRLLAPWRQGQGKLGLATTKPGSILKKHIPVRSGAWDETRSGYLEADTVAHCGTSIEGQFVYTLNTVDIATGWSEQRACWGKGQTGIFHAVTDIRSALPFPLRGFDCDNGTEFINWRLYDYLHRSHRHRPVHFTRGREGQPNDNAHIEEKNWTRIRQYLGYERFDNPAVVPVLNALYSGPWRLFVNGFVPSVKLIEKRRIGARVLKRYDAPQTPLERTLKATTVSKKIKRELEATFAHLNPFLLQQQIQEAIHHIMRLAPCGDPACPHHLNNDRSAQREEENNGC